jgi:hypothetical protein
LRREAGKPFSTSCLVPPTYDTFEPPGRRKETKKKTRAQIIRSQTERANPVYYPNSGNLAPNRIPLSIKISSLSNVWHLRKIETRKQVAEEEENFRGRPHRDVDVEEDRNERLP